MDAININFPKPSWKGCLSYGWETMKKYFLPLFLIVIVLAIVDSLIQSQSFGNSTADKIQVPVWLEILGMAYWLLFVPVISYSADLLFIQAVRNERLEVKNIIIGFNNYLNIILTNVLVVALVGIALVALIIPGIIVGCRLAFVSYLVMDKNLDPITAVETSWKLTRGYGWKIFALGFISIFIFFGGLLLAVVGALPAVMWIKSSFAALYQAVLNEKGDDFFLEIETDKTE